MAVIGRPTHYDHLIAAIDDDDLYTPESIWDYAELHGLISVDRIGAGFQDYKANAIKALKMRAVRKLPSLPDGFLQSPNGAELKAYFGYRWKSTLRGQQGRAARHLVEKHHGDDVPGSALSAKEGARLRSFLAFYAGLSHVLISFMAILLQRMLRIQPMLVLHHYFQTNQKQALQAALYESKFEPYRSYILASLARLNFKTIAFEGNLEDILGVFLFASDRGFFHRFGQVRCGQWVVVNGVSGYLYYVSGKQLVLSLSGELRSFELPDMAHWVSSAPLIDKVLVFGCMVDALLPVSAESSAKLGDHSKAYVAGCFFERSFERFLEGLAALHSSAEEVLTPEDPWFVIFGVAGLIGPADRTHILKQICKRLLLATDVTKLRIVTGQGSADRQSSGTCFVLPSKA